MVAFVIYRNSGKEAFRDHSPDGRFYVVVYRLPNFSWTPGSSSDAPAIARLCDASGKTLREGDVEMLQMAEVEWGEGEVMVSKNVWQLK